MAGLVIAIQLHFPRPLRSEPTVIRYPGFGLSDPEEGVFSGRSDWLTATFFRTIDQMEGWRQVTSSSGCSKGGIEELLVIEGDDRRAIYDLIRGRPESEREKGTNIRRVLDAIESCDAPLRARRWIKPLH